MQIVKQDGYKDCGVASLLSVIRYYGGDNSLENLREITGTTRKGVSAYNLIEAAKILGFESYGLEGDIDQLDDSLLPIISHVIINRRYQHFVVIYKIDRKNKKVLIMDPAHGKKNISFAQFGLLTSKNYIYLKPIKKIGIVKTKNIISNVFKKFLYQNKYLYIYMTIFSLLLLLLNIVSSFHLKILINKAIEPRIIKNVYVLSLFILVIFLYKGIMNCIKSITVLKWQTKLSERLTTFLFDKLMFLSYSYYKNRTTGEVISRMQDLNTMKDFLTKFCSSVIIDPLCLVIFVSCLFFINKYLTICVLLFTLLLIVIEIVSNKLIKLPLYRYYLKEDQVNSILIENIGVNSICTIKNNHIENRVINRFNNINIKYLDKAYIVSIIIVMKGYIEDNLREILNVVLLFIGSVSIIHNKLELSSLIIFQSLLGNYLASFLRIIDVIKEYEHYKIAKNRIEDMCSISGENFACCQYFKNYKLNGSIKFCKLIYVENGKKIFNKLNFTILNKEKLFLFGSSGSGKTTLMRMLLGYVKVGMGMIFVNSMDINHYHLDVLRNRITYVSQQEVLFTDTIKENITLGSDISSDKFKKVCKLTMVDNIINRTNLKEMEIVEENGANYSGGERQRIILARAILRESDIYIFDEALSQIDIENANIIVKNIFSYLRDKTIIIISHRTPKIDLYNRVLKLDGGVIVEESLQ